MNVENQKRIKNVMSNTNNAVGAVLSSNRISTQSEELKNAQPATIGNYKLCSRFSFKMSVTKVYQSLQLLIY